MGQLKLLFLLFLQAQPIQACTSATTALQACTAAQAAWDAGLPQNACCQACCNGASGTNLCVGGAITGLCPDASSGSGDPHMQDGQGGYFDFMGKNMTVYNLLSTNNVSVNALFKHTDYNDAGSKKRLIHGSFMTAAYVATKASDGRILQIEYDATRAVLLPIKIDGAAPTVHHAPASMSVGNVDISLKDRTMTIITSAWVVTASSKMKKGILRGNSCATGKCFLNIGIEPVTDVGHAAVAPHGLLGQAYDGDDVSIVGATDEYKGVEFYTSAMGEGAIEGTAKDYEMADKFATDFKFSRWGLEMAKPRNVSTLTGVKVKHAQMVPVMAAASAADVGDEESGVTVE